MEGAGGAASRAVGAWGDAGRGAQKSPLGAPECWLSPHTPVIRDIARTTLISPES